MKTLEEQIKAISGILSKNGLAPMFTFTFGKYEGKSLQEVADKDPSYLIWLRDNNYRFSQEVLKFIGTLRVDK